MIKSLSNSQEEILKNIIDLYIPQGYFDIDPTYSTGNFYKGSVPQPKYKYDINPQVEGVQEASADELPWSDSSADSIIFDPPFLATTGPSLLEKLSKKNKMVQRFGHFPNEEKLHSFYLESMKEFYRILKNKGILVFKCQDKVSSGKQYLSHVWIINKALELGFYPIDIFILGADNRMVAKWQRNQKHSRKFHCYFVVFKKMKSKVDYKKLGNN